MHSDYCPTCKQVLPWKRPEVKEEQPRNILKPPKPRKPTKEELAAQAEKERLEAVEWMRKGARCCICWLCNAHVNIRVYSDHMDKHRKEGFVPRPFKSSRSAAEIKAEWQEADA